MTTDSAAGPEGGPTRRVMFGVKLWPRTIEQLDEVAAVRYPDVPVSRRKSPAARDLLALGFAALEAGYEPGDTIPKKLAR